MSSGGEDHMASSACPHLSSDVSSGRKRALVEHTRARSTSGEHQAACPRSWKHMTPSACPLVFSNDIRRGHHTLTHTHTHMHAMPNHTCVRIKRSESQAAWVRSLAR
jgi:hypothetical protein